MKTTTSLAALDHFLTVDFVLGVSHTAAQLHTECDRYLHKVIDRSSVSTE